ncbi:hypothetical protein PMKS-003235 [Pichia membranifaciens]|uniref:Uncharacterized protein n=1 Tax=Pichia membranifaciens TaxID=4926 RepID=A0A1Q2YK38_9ASCO|nr:hypothetical protein PMKS-003235 [Pichia membranifaciens]
MQKLFLGDWKKRSPMLSKLRKVRSTILSTFTEKNNNEEKHQGPVNDGSSTPYPVIAGSSFQDVQNPITARQLEAYYNSLKLQNEALTEKLNRSSVIKGQTTASNVDDNSTRRAEKVANSWNNAESTNIEQGNSVASAKSSIPVEKNAVILFDESPESDAEMDDYPESLGLPQIISQPDPLERANLVQLKKMMEMEKYRRYRLSYLREHTRHVNRSGINKVSKSIMRQKYKKLGKSLDAHNLPKERQNKSGMFGISLLDTVDDTAIEIAGKESQIVKPIDDNIMRKLKFPASENSAANFAMPTKAKSFYAEEPKVGNQTKANENHIEKKPSFSSVSSEKPMFVFKETDIAPRKETDLSVDEKPSVAFSFNPPTPTKTVTSEPTNPTSTSKSTSDSKLAALSFGNMANLVEAKKEASTPTFSFGSTTDSSKNGFKKAIIENIPDEDGLNDASMDRIAKRKAPSTSDDNNQTTKSKKTFSFGVPTSSSFTIPNAPQISTKNLSDADAVPPEPQNASHEPKVTSSFQFGKSTSTTTSQGPLLNFGISKNDDKSKSSFESTTATAEKPSFSFGTAINKATEDQKNAGSETKPAPKPVFNFGSSAQTGDAPNFSLNGVSNAEGPKHVVGSSDAEKAAEKPTSLFGGSINTKTDDEVKPLFGDLKSINTSGFSAGNKGAESKSGFPFGTPSTTSGVESNGNEGAAKIDGKKQPSLTFGIPAGSSAAENGKSSSKTPAPAPTKPTFNFGANIPVSSFGSTASLGGNTENKQPNGISTTNALGESKFNFGNDAASTDLVGVSKRAQPPSAPASSTGSGFKFNAGSSTPNTPGVFSGFNNSPKPSANPKIEEVKSTLGAPATGFAFGTSVNSPSMFGSANSDTKKIFGATGMDGTADKSTFGNTGSTGTKGFTFGTSGGASAFGNSQSSNSPAFGVVNQPPATNKIFSINNNAFPSLNQAPKTALSGFGGAGGTGGAGQSPSFNFSPASAASNAVGFPSAPSAFGGMTNNGNSGNNSTNNGMMNMGNMFGGNAGNPGFPNANMSSGGNSSAGNSRSGTPSFNFTGQSGNVDPSSIFQSSQNGTPPPGQSNIMTRKRAYPRGMRNRRQ